MTPSVVPVHFLFFPQLCYESQVSSTQWRRTSMEKGETRSKLRQLAVIYSPSFVADLQTSFSLFDLWEEQLFWVRWQQEKESKPSRASSAQKKSVITELAWNHLPAGEPCDAAIYLKKTLQLNWTKTKDVYFTGGLREEARGHNPPTEPKGQLSTTNMLLESI